MSDDDDKKLLDLLKKAGEQKVDYPQFNERRKEFQRRQFFRTPIGCFLLLLVIAFLAILFLYALNHQYIGFYNGLNKGVYFLNCGFEFTGEFGLFCGSF